MACCTVVVWRQAGRRRDAAHRRAPEAALEAAARASRSRSSSREGVSPVSVSCSSTSISPACHL